MPLIIVCGNPCSGKTTFSKYLKEYLSSKSIVNVVIVNEEILNISKQVGYSNSSTEKSTRGSLKSAVDQQLNSESYLIIDSLNYIKGFRYELYCCSRTFRTPHCVVWVECLEGVSDRWNEERRCVDSTSAYSKEILSDLRKRFEAPNDANRWDHPLFKVNMTPMIDIIDNNNNIEDTKILETLENNSNQIKKSSWKPKTNSISSNNSVFTMNTTSSTIRNSSLNNNTMVSFSGSTKVKDKDYLKEFSTIDIIMEEIYKYLIDASAPVPNSATVPVHHAEADLLYELDRVSQKIMQMIVTFQSEQSLEGTPIRFTDYNRVLLLNRHISLVELQRYRRQYVKINQQHPPHSSIDIGTSFIDYLALQI